MPTAAEAEVNGYLARSALARHARDALEARRRRELARMAAVVRRPLHKPRPAAARQPRRPVRIPLAALSASAAPRLAAPRPADDAWAVKVAAAARATRF
jgi:hypothetical protein